MSTTSMVAPAATPTTATRTQLLSFVLAGEEYAVDILRVREIIEYSTVTRVPGMPRSVRGVINLRGRVVPVMDLAVRFALPESVITPRSSIVVVELPNPDGDIVIGIITDAVTAVPDLETARVRPTPSFGTTVGSEFLDGIAETEKDTLVMLLNIDRALGPDAFVQVS